MKRLFILVLMLACFEVFPQTHVQFTIQNLAGGTPTNRPVWVTPMSVPSVGSGGVIIGDRYVTNSNNNGLFVISNMPQSQLYLVEVQAPPTKTVFKIYTSTNNPGFVDATNLLVADSTATFPAGAVAWAVNASDARYAFKANASGILVAPGTNVTAVTNGPGTLVTFSGPVAGQNVAAGSNITLTTNGVTVTIAAAGSAQTNMAVAGITNAGTAAYSNAAAFYPSNNPAGYAPSNALGGAAFVATSTFDASGSATSATQGLAAIYGTAAKSNATAFALAGIPLTNGETRNLNVLGSSNYVLGVVSFAGSSSIGSGGVAAFAGGTAGVDVNGNWYGDGHLLTGIGTTSIVGTTTNAINATNLWGKITPTNLPAGLSSSNFVGSYYGDGSGLSNVVVSGVSAGTNITVANGATVSLVAVPAFNGSSVTNIPQSGVVGLVTALAGKVSTATAVNTASPLLGGGGLASTLSLSIQKATSGQDGYLSAADFTTFSAASGTTEWQTNGNDTGTTGFLGTTNTSDLVFKVNNSRVAKFRGSDGSVMFGPVNNDVVNGSGMILSLGTGNTNNSCSADTAILSGTGNTIVGGTQAIIVGGNGNRIWPPGALPENTLVGGLANTILTNAQIGFLGGGEFNQVGGFGSVVSGGYNNLASGQASTVPGGYLNTASANVSFAAGNQAKAVHTGAFVWADSQVADYSSVANDTFNIRARNGIYLNGQVFMTGAVSKPIKKVTTAYTLTSSDYTILYNGSGAATVITLPTAVGCSNVFVIKNIHATGTCVITNATGTQNIDGALSILNNVQYRSYTVHADGTQWWIE